MSLIIIAIIAFLAIIGVVFLIKILSSNRYDAYSMSYMGGAPSKTTIIIIAVAIIAGLIVSGIYGYFKYFKKNSISISPSEKTKISEVKKVESNSNSNINSNRNNLDIISASDEDKLILVSENGSSKIIDYEGNVKYELPKEVPQYGNVLANNYIYTKKNYNDNKSYVYNLKGENVYSVEGNILGISKNGFALTQEEKTNMAKGDYTEYNVVDLKKKQSIKTINSYDISGKVTYSSYKDYFIIEKGYSSNELFDASTLKSFDNYSGNKDYLEIEGKVLRYITLPYTNNKSSGSITGVNVLDLKRNLAYHANKIIDLNENVKKDISEGGIYYIYLYGDTIFVTTDTKYVYTLNADTLEYKTNPIKFENTDLPESVFFSAGYGTSGTHRNSTDEKATDNIITTEGGFYYIKSKGAVKDENGIKKTNVSIDIIDSNTFKSKNKLEINVDDLSKDVKVNNNTLITKTSDGTVTIYCGEKSLKFEDASFNKISNSIITITSANGTKIYNTKNMEEINIK